MACILCAKSLEDATVIEMYTLQGCSLHFLIHIISVYTTLGKHSMIEGGRNNEWQLIMEHNLGLQLYNRLRLSLAVLMDSTC